MPNEVLIQDLIDYFPGYPEELIRSRCNAAIVELAFQFHSFCNKPENYYADERIGELYLFDLTSYQSKLRDNGHHNNMLNDVRHIIRRDNINPSILEYGGGIGEFTRLCATDMFISTHSQSICYYDLKGPIRTYAGWRFHKHMSEFPCSVPYMIPVHYTDMDINDELNPLNNPYLNNTYNLDIPHPLDFSWDIVNIMDVLEHMFNPDLVLYKLSQNCKYIFCNPDQVNYNYLCPQHISKFDLFDHGFEKVINSGGYLWKNRRVELWQK